MDKLGKGLFWLGFIILIGVIFAYLIIMLAGSVAFATTSAVLSICVIILVGTLLMVMGRGYEHRAARKREAKLTEHTEQETSSK